MAEIDLLQRKSVQRKFDPNWRTDKNREIAKRFDFDFFDGDRANGYGGYKYDGRWVKVAERLKMIYGLNGESAFLDVGCAKGFLLHDLRKVIPGIRVAGVDISRYAINNGIDEVKPFMVLASADELPYADGVFDFVFSSDTIHNLPRERCKKALQEMTRVCKLNGNLFVQVDAYRIEQEKKNMELWNLTAQTHMYVSEWLNFFNEAGYRGDYFWTIMSQGEDRK